MWLSLLVSGLLIMKSYAGSCNNYMGFALNRCNSDTSENETTSVMYSCDEEGNLYRDDFVGWDCPSDAQEGRTQISSQEPFLCTSNDDDVCGLASIVTISPCTAVNNPEEIEVKTQHYYVTDYCVMDNDIFGNATRMSCVTTSTYTVTSYSESDSCDTSHYQVSAQNSGCNTQINESFSISCISNSGTHLHTMLTGCLFGLLWLMWSNL